MAVVTQCDQCKRVDADSKNWLQMGVPKRQEEPENPLAAIYGGGSTFALVHLCSWPCARDYALLQVLDQEMSDAPEG